MSLDSQYAAFQERARNQPVLLRPATVVRVQQPQTYAPSPSDTVDAYPPPQGLRGRVVDASRLAPPAKRQKTSIVYSQPKDTGTGQQLLTQIIYAVDYLKQQPKPISIDKIASYLSTVPSTAMVNLLRDHPKVTYHPDTDLYEFRPMLNIRNESSLLATLAKETTAAGIPVKELKEGYPNVEDDLRRLETMGHVLVIRGKDGQARMVWYNDPALNVAMADEFKQMFRDLKVPDTADLPQALEKLGMTHATVDPRSIKRETVKDKKRKNRRRGKLLNTHLPFLAF